MQCYFKPGAGAVGRAGTRPLGGPWARFAEVEVHERGRARQVLPADAVETLYPGAAAALARASALRGPVAGVALDRPVLMGVVNVTPDSFSDGGQFPGAEAAVAHGLHLAEAGAAILDIGGESTRPGAQPLPPEHEIARVVPVIEGLVAAGCPVPISIDTRNAPVAAAALAAGARILNDVSALRHDPGMLPVAGHAEAVCLMHAQGDPRTMQDAPHYDDVLLDVFDHLAERIATCEAAGLSRARLIVDPGIGFGKTLAHNLALIRGLSLFQTLGCAVLLGASRKGFIGRLSGETTAARRAPGSIAAGLAGVAQGVQILRVHDVAETAQALSVWHAVQEASV